MSEIQDEAYTELCQENEQLKAVNTDFQRECANRGQRIADLERLIARAADALDTARQGGSVKTLFYSNLIAELRKAAE